MGSKIRTCCLIPSLPPHPTPCSIFCHCIGVFPTPERPRTLSGSCAPPGITGLFCNRYAAVTITAPAFNHRHHLMADSATVFVAAVAANPSALTAMSICRRRPNWPLTQPLAAAVSPWSFHASSHRC
eukprot:5481648-Pleurochrysis_carterae.AAC.1